MKPGKKQTNALASPAARQPPEQKPSHHHGTTSSEKKKKKKKKKQALKGADSHAGIPTPQPGRTNTSNLLDIVIALRPVVTYHGRDRLQCQPTCQLPRV